MSKRILIINGHPDVDPGHYVHALAWAYVEGAKSAGHEVQTIRVAELDFPLLRNNQDFLTGTPPAVIRESQEKVVWAQHLVILYPLWLGSMPALLKGFLEQLLRPGFAFAAVEPRRPQKHLKDKSARIIVTVGMPSLFYRWYYRAHSLKSLERNILAFCGIGPLRASIVGMVEAMGQEKRVGWLAKARELGRRSR